MDNGSARIKLYCIPKKVCEFQTGQQTRTDGSIMRGTLNDRSQTKRHTEHIAFFFMAKLQ